jgi:uncharacterized membrane protein
MDWTSIQKILVAVQHFISAIGVAVILTGVIIAIYKFINYFFKGDLISQNIKINAIRLELGRILILGLEFIVAADLIGSTTTPDYYALGILVIIVAIRTLLSFSLNKEMAEIGREC